MPRNGSGTYLPPGGTTAVSGATISSSAYNDYVNDNATAMSESVNTSGTKSWTANQSVGGFKFTSLGAGTALGDSANLQQTQERVIAWAQATGTGDVILVSYTPVITAYTNGMTLSFRGSAANTVAAPTLNANSVGARKIFKAAASALVAGDIAGAAHDCQITYNTALDSGAGGWLLHNPQSTQSLNIVGLTAETAIATGDLFALYDLSETANNSISFANVMKGINVLTETTIDPNADYIPFYDASGAIAGKALARNLKPSEVWMYAVSDETTTITAGTGKLTVRAPRALTVTAVRSSLTTVSSSGLVTVDINEAGVSILSTTLSIDASEKTSTTAATAAAISDASIADDAEITFDIDAAGTGAKGLKVYIIGYPT
jgi:hypothetical protein